MYECVRPDTSWRHPVKDGVTWRIPSACMCVWMWLCVWMCVPRYNPVKDGMTWRIPVASRVPWITIIHPFSLSIIHYNPKQYNNSSFLIINRMRIRYIWYMVNNMWYMGGTCSNLWLPGRVLRLRISTLISCAPYYLNMFPRQEVLNHF